MGRQTRLSLTWQSGHQANTLQPAHVHCPPPMDRRR